MTPSLIGLEGAIGLDAHLNSDTKVELVPEGVAYRDPTTGTWKVLRTDQPPGSGGKRNALDSLGPLFRAGLIARTELAGGAWHASVFLAGLLSGAGHGTRVLLLNAGRQLARLEDLAARKGVRCVSLARQEMFCNLVVQPRHGKDRLILRRPTTPCPLGLDDAQRQIVGQALGEANALASVSARDSAVAAAASAMCNGARHYFQATGSLSPEMTLLHLSAAHEVVANLEEWCRVAHWADLTLPGVAEDSPEAPEAAAQLLRALHARRWAGAEAAVCTLGRNGAVVLDWTTGRAHHLALEMIDGEGVPTPAGAGDRFLAAWIFYRETWARQGHLRDPFVATGLRVTQAVARALGLSSATFDVRPVRL